MVPLTNAFQRSRFTQLQKEINMITVLLVILLLMAIGAFPSWNHSRSWGYFPSGGLGLVVLVLLILLLLGRV